MSQSALEVFSLPLPFLPVTCMGAVTPSVYRARRSSLWDSLARHTQEGHSTSDGRPDDTKLPWQQVLLRGLWAESHPCLGRAPGYPAQRWPMESGPMESGQGACLLGTLAPTPTGHWAQVPGETSPCSHSAGDSQPVLRSENSPTPPPPRERKPRPKDRTDRLSGQWLLWDQPWQVDSTVLAFS